MAGAFDRDSQLALVAGTCTGLAAWADFALVGDISAQQLDVLVVDNSIFLTTKLAFLWPGKKPATTLTFILI